MRKENKNNPTEADIMAHWDKRMRKPWISICCATYNHAEFIDTTLRGFLIQVTKFPFEILLRDDGSSDGTARIIREYQKWFPNIVKLKLEPINKFILGEKPAEYFFAASDAKYLAWCDGDDFWTDPQKLQKQVSFLENNKDFVMVGHDCINYDRINNSYSEPSFHKVDGSRKKLLSGAIYAPTLTRVHRHEIRELPLEFRRVTYGDVFINSLFGRFSEFQSVLYLSNFESRKS